MNPVQKSYGNDWLLKHESARYGGDTEIVNTRLE